MAMEMWVFSNRRVESIAEWQRAIDSENYPLKLSIETPFEDLKGFLPATLYEEATGFECDHRPAEEFIRYMQREMPDLNLGHDWEFVLAFRWRGDLDELLAAWMAAAAYASATDGIILDDQEAKIRTAAEAIEGVWDLVHQLPQVKVMMQQIQDFS
jgi:hypothetical protein